MSRKDCTRGAMKPAPGSAPALSRYPGCLKVGGAVPFPQGALGAGVWAAADPSSSSTTAALHAPAQARPRGARGPSLGPMTAAPTGGPENTCWVVRADSRRGTPLYRGSNNKNKKEEVSAGTL